MKQTWIEDDSDVIDVIDSAQKEWFEAHANENLPPTDETTDEEINAALGLPRSGALRSLANEFAEWSKKDISRAVWHGLDAWSNRAEVRYETMIDYSSAPSADQFHAVTVSELERISEEIDASENSSLTTEWSRGAWEMDREACDKALALARTGKTVLVAQDEDGYYFAVRRR